jgi:hypothetical protein
MDAETKTKEEKLRQIHRKQERRRIRELKVKDAIKAQL